MSIARVFKGDRTREQIDVQSDTQFALVRRQILG